MKALAKEIAQAIAKQAEAIDSHREQEMLVQWTLVGSAIVRKGSDHEAIVNAAVPYDKLLAVALSKLNGVTVEAIVREALEAEVLSTDEVKAQAEEAIKRFKAQAVKTVAGRTTIKSQTLEVAEIEICPKC